MLINEGVKMKEVTFKKYGLSPSDVEYYRGMGILPDKRTLKNLINAYNSNSKPDITNIYELEKKIGFCIDTDYINFLLKNNGGIPSNNSIENKNVVIDHFLSFKSDYKFNSLIDLYQEFNSYGLPIARTPGGDTIILHADERIYLYSHNIGSIDKNIGLLANNFLDLINKLN